MKRIAETMLRLVAVLLSRWERPGKGASHTQFAESAKLEHLSAVALAKVEAIKANLRGLGYAG